MTDDKKKPTVQINFRTDPALREQFEAAVFDYGYRTGRRKLTQNQVLIELVEGFVQKVAATQPESELRPEKENEP